jgi:hypothetical protein
VFRPSRGHFQADISNKLLTGLLNFIKKQNLTQKHFKLHIKLANEMGKQWELIQRSIDVQLGKKYKTMNKKLEKPIRNEISLPHMICILPSMFQI